MKMVLWPVITQLSKNRWKAEIFTLEGKKAVMTVYGATNAEAEHTCLENAHDKGWNIVTISKSNRIEGFVDASVYELLDHNRQTFPKLLAQRLAPGLVLNKIKFRAENDGVSGHRWLSFMVSGCIVKKETQTSMKKCPGKSAKLLTT